MQILERIIRIVPPPIGNSSRTPAHISWKVLFWTVAGPLLPGVVDQGPVVEIRGRGGPEAGEDIVLHRQGGIDPLDVEEGDIPVRLSDRRIFVPRSPGQACRWCRSRKSC